MRKHLKILISVSFLMFLLSCNTSNEKKNKELYKSHKGYIIDGTLAKGNAKYVYLLNENNDKLDSVRIKKYSFSLKGNVKAPNKYYLQVQKSDIKHPIILENNHYKMLLDGDKSMIIGGKLNTIFSNYQTTKTQFAKEKSNFLEQFSKRDLDLRPYLNLVDSIRKIEKKMFENFIIDNNNNILSSLLLSEIDLSSKEASILKNKLEVKNLKPQLISKLEKIINIAKITEEAEKIERRKPVPLFSGVNLEGRQTHLKNIIKNKKAFLIDFWASWCPPCRASSPTIKRLYNTYKHKGFDVLTISEDRSVDEWKSGVFIDDIEDWHHIYDDFNRISKMFDVSSLPHMVLLDENGKIIKNKISMSNLEEQLEKIFNDK